MHSIGENAGSQYLLKGLKVFEWDFRIRLLSGFSIIE